ncbi:Macro domain-containing protein [Cladobotryum mycophilum]|uniref:Macro domain-containing protein n=1 Tax=Cladobotryum mycophilum TaxID=491253 RepID=A0ABR0SYM8_9HYPO
MAVSGIKWIANVPSLNNLYSTNLIHPSSSSYNPNPSINARVGLHRGDITTLQADAIVNAANSFLRGGGGVDGAVHRAAGPDLLRELKALNRTCPTGDAVITRGHRLPARHVIHAVGPIYQIRQDDAAPLLESCYRKSLDIAVQNGLKTVAFSCISTGVYGYPSDEAAKIACETVRKYLEADQEEKIQKVVFVVFENKDVIAYNETLP